MQQPSAPNADQFKQSFREEAREILVDLEAALLELNENRADMELVGRVFRALHTIKGSGSMFGFEELAAVHAQPGDGLRPGAQRAARDQLRVDRSDARGARPDSRHARRGRRNRAGRPGSVRADSVQGAAAGRDCGEPGMISKRRLPRRPRRQPENGQVQRVACPLCARPGDDAERHQSPAAAEGTAPAWGSLGAGQHGGRSADRGTRSGALLCDLGDGAGNFGGPRRHPRCVHLCRRQLRADD